LRPLRAQAEQARRHVEITAALREIRIRRLVAELTSLERDRSRAMANRTGAAGELDELRSRLETLRSRRLDADRRLGDARHASGGVRRGLEHLRSAQASALRAVIAMRERVNARPDVRRLDAVTAKLRALDAEETEVRTGLDDNAAALNMTEQAIASLSDRRTEH